MKRVANEEFFARVEELLAEEGRVVVLHAGHSMRPLLRHGRDRLVLVGCKGAEVRPGDVVLVRYRGRHILHRILRRKGEELLLAGDGNYRIEERCREGAVVARLSEVIRPSGRTLACDSRMWRSLSRGWLLLPAPLRHIALRIGWHLGWR